MNIDPQNLPEVERLRALIGLDIYTDHLSNALAAFERGEDPRKPEEPAGVGAVVRLRGGGVATRFRTTGKSSPEGADWVTDDGCHVQWQHLPATGLLGEGVA